MKSNMQRKIGTNGRSRRITSIAASSLALGWTAAQAQPVFVPPVNFQDRVTTVEQASTNWVGSFAAPPLQAPAAGPETYPLEWGPVRFHPHLGYQVVYGDGILLGTNNPQTTVLQTITPGAFLELGKYWNFDFSVGINRYSNADFNNSESYFLALRGHIPREKWLLDFGYLGSSTDQPQVETGAQIKQSTHLVTASGTYNYQTRLSLELSAALDARVVENLSDYYTISTLEWLNYQATSKTTVGVGLGGGYNAVSPGGDWAFEQLQGRFIWSPGSKFTLQFSGGAQFQHFQVGGSENATFPVFAALAAYRPFEATTLSVSGSHVIGNSYESDQFIETSKVGVGLHQRFFGRAFLDVAPAYNFARYKSTTAGHALAREDDFFTVYAGLSIVLFKKLNAAVFYQFSDNSSTVNGFGFDSQQTGLRLDYRY